MKKALPLILTSALCLSLALPAAAAEAPVAATVSPQTLRVNGEIIKCQKYNIDGSNYFKLRDLASLLNNTGSQFEVSWNAEANTVSITTGRDYSTVSKELLLGADASATAQPTAQTILVNGKAVSDIKVYNIGGSNYFKLRDLGEALGFDVDYDADTDTALVNSRRPRSLKTRHESVGRYQVSSWDEDGNEVTTEGTSTTVETYAYTPEGWLETYTSHYERDNGDIEDESRTYTYDAEGRVLTEKKTGTYGSDGNTTVQTYAYTYDAKGNVIQETATYGDDDPQTTDYTYNDRGFVTEARYQYGNYVRTTFYTYDERNNQLTETRTDSDGTSVITRTYDDAGNMLTEIPSGESSYATEIRKTYNEAGQLLTAWEKSSFDDGDSTTEETINSYDEAGNLVKSTAASTYVWDGETKTYVVENVYTYDASGRQLSYETKNDGELSDAAVYTYDDDGRLLTTAYTSADESLNFTETYFYDEAGREIRIEGENADGAYTCTRSYDEFGNLTEITSYPDEFYSIWTYETETAL